MPWLWISTNPGVRKWQVHLSLPQFPVHLSTAAIEPFSTKTLKGPSSHRPWGKTTICAQMIKGAAIFWWRPWRSTEGTVIWEQDWTLRPEAKRILGESLRWQERLRTLEKTRGVYEFAKNFLTLYWRIKMLSSALRVGFSRVSVAAKRCLVPTINAGNFIIVLEHTFSFSKNCVHVELAVRGYCCYTQDV